MKIEINNEEWRAIKARPDEWRQVVEFDRAIRYAGGMQKPTYLHRDCKPIDEVDLTDPAEGQLTLLDECEGMCGV